MFDEIGVEEYYDEGLTDEDVEAIMDDYNYVGNKSHY